MKRKNILTETILWTAFFMVAVFSFSSCNKDGREEINDKEIIKQITDERGLTSVIYREGKDTFGFDYLTRHEYDSIFPNFINGEILLPDYSHTDTLQVINAAELNRIFDGVDISILPATDSEIDSTLHLYCQVVNRNYQGFIKTKYICPDCGEWGCIYEDIDSWYDGSEGNDLNKAIYEVCAKKGITDSATIYLIKANYEL